MLIDAEISRLCERGRLFRVESDEWRAEQRRTIYVSTDLNRFLIQEFTDLATNKDRRRVQRLFDRFISGEMISVAFKQNIKGPT